MGFLWDSSGIFKNLNPLIYLNLQDERDVQVEKSTTPKGEKHKEIVKKKFISLAQNFDEPHSDEEIEKAPLQCQYKVGVGIMRQGWYCLRLYILFLFYILDSSKY